MMDGMLGHGFEMALLIGDRYGQLVELAWFREHEALPLHDVSDCPMRPADH